MGLAQFGNDLYTGRRSIDFVGRRHLWYLLSAGLIALSLFGLLGRGLNFGLEFRGGTEIRVSGISQLTSDYETRATTAVQDHLPAGSGAQVTRIGSDTVRVQTERLDDSAQGAEAVRTALAEEFDVPASDVSTSFVGPSWGAQVSKKALYALLTFLALVTLVLSLYFRTWKMAFAALVALLHDLVFTVGTYALTGFEVSPATVIGFLTILGYSLYDTVVVFDKVRENTDAALAGHRMTFAQAANLAINQTLIRSINTTVVALLPVAVILAVGSWKLGPGTLMDLALALFLGMAIGAFSSIFIATPLYAHLRQGDEDVRASDRRARAYEEQHGGADAAGHTADDVRALQGAGSSVIAMPEGEDRTVVGGGRERHPLVDTSPRRRRRTTSHAHR